MKDVIDCYPAIETYRNRAKLRFDPGKKLERRAELVVIGLLSSRLLAFAQDIVWRAGLDTHKDVDMFAFFYDQLKRFESFSTIIVETTDGTMYEIFENYFRRNGSVAMPYEEYFCLKEDDHSLASNGFEVESIPIRKGAHIKIRTKEEVIITDRIIRYQDE